VEVEQLNGGLLDPARACRGIRAFAALGESDDELPVGCPCRIREVADRPQHAARFHLLWRAAVGGDGEDLARLALRAALEGDLLAVRRPVGVLVDSPDGRIGELPFVAPTEVDSEDRPVCLCVVEESSEGDPPAGQLNVRGNRRLGGRLRRRGLVRAAAAGRDE
jgi:hypothetical protein